MVKHLQNLSIRIKIMVPLAVVIIVALGVTFYWMSVRQETEITNQIKAQAKALFQHVVLTRAWVAEQGHGGVYVEKLEGVETNPYLNQIAANLNVDIEGINGQFYTLRNPALVTRQLSELAQKRGEDFSFRITSLNPINPGNSPTPWEAESLRSFEQGVAETNLIEQTQDGDVYRYMAPLIVTETCLQCHASQGYKLGDIRGGISVTVPMAQAQAAIDQNRQQLLLTGFGITMVVLLIVYVVVNKLVVVPLQAIETAAREISRGQLVGRVPVTSNDELGRLGASFNQMTERLQGALVSAEQQIEERTRRLETAASLAEKISGILDLNTLLYEIVNQIRDTFNYYHAHIYLLDEAETTLIMTEGSGIAGQEMKRKGHSIPLAAAKSLVARAARTGQIVIENDVRQTEDWLPNPLLPDTRSEIAVPIKFGFDGKILGVLDVQQNRTDAIDRNDASLLRSLAGQIAVSVNNARQFGQVEAALSQAKAVQTRYLQQSWQDQLLDSLERNQRVYRAAGAEPLPHQLRAAAEQAALDHSDLVQLDFEDETATAAAVAAPIKIGAQTIGVFQAFRDASQSQRWTEEEMGFISAALDQFAQTAENLRLLDETRDRASREQAIREITEKLRASPNLDFLLETAARELGTRLGVHHTVIELGAEPSAPGQNGGNGASEKL